MEKQNVRVMLEFDGALVTDGMKQRELSKCLYLMDTARHSKIDFLNKVFQDFKLGVTPRHLRLTLEDSENILEGPALEHVQDGAKLKIMLQKIPSRSSKRKAKQRQLNRIRRSSKKTKQCK